MITVSHLEIENLVQTRMEFLGVNSNCKSKSYTDELLT